LPSEIIQRQFLFTTRAPCRKVIFAFGHRWHAAKYAATATSKSS
jgi:hypothetical protein